MTVSIAPIVSKRLQPPTFALLCLMVLQLGFTSLSSCHEEPLPMGAVRVSLR